MADAELKRDVWTLQNVGKLRQPVKKFRRCLVGRRHATSVPDERKLVVPRKPSKTYIHHPAIIMTSVHNAQDGREWILDAYSALEPKFTYYRS
eukprot:scaffold37964_cov205-Skeletonema_marinoi.AAC.6